jgi:hypothetical protein
MGCRFIRRVFGDLRPCGGLYADRRLTVNPYLTPTKSKSIDTTPHLRVDRRFVRP